MGRNRTRSDDKPRSTISCRKLRCASLPRTLPIATSSYFSLTSAAASSLSADAVSPGSASSSAPGNEFEFHLVPNDGRARAKPSLLPIPSNRASFPDRLFSTSKKSAPRFGVRSYECADCTSGLFTHRYRESRSGDEISPSDEIARRSFISIYLIDNGSAIRGNEKRVRAFVQHWVVCIFHRFMASLSKNRAFRVYVSCRWYILHGDIACELEIPLVGDNSRDLGPCMEIVRLSSFQTISLLVPIQILAIDRIRLHRGKCQLHFGSLDFSPNGTSYKKTLLPGFKSQPYSAASNVTP